MLPRHTNPVDQGITCPVQARLGLALITEGMRPANRRVLHTNLLGLSILACEEVAQLQLLCGHCGGRREVLKCITDPRVIDRILTHLGLKTVLPEVAPVTFPRRCRDPHKRGKLPGTRAAGERLAV